MIYTLFLSPQIAAWGDNVDDPQMSRFMSQFVGDSKYNILYQRIEQYELDDGDTRTLAFANYASSDWVFLIAKVVGTAHVNLAGLDTDGVSVISSKIPFYGDSNFPGIGIMSSYNLTSLEFEGDADGTRIELYAAISCADDDTLLVQNA